MLLREFPTLYNTTVNTTRTKQWTISVLQMPATNEFIVQTKHGMLGGKLITNETIITEGKNIGKKNETSPKEQALLEAERDWNKKQRQGYSISLVESNKGDNKSKLSKNIKPMLAVEFNRDKEMDYPVLVQPKLDGTRCMVYMLNGHIVFQSRLNTVYAEFTHLIPELMDIFSFAESVFGANTSNFILDGELYNHDLPFEKITGLVRSKTRDPTEVLQIQYHIYDCIDTENTALTNLQRNNILSNIFGSMSSTQYVKLVETNVANSLEEIIQYHSTYTEIGYEGIMLRNPNGIYKQQNRSKFLQKYKTFMDEEFLVVGYTEGTGSYAGTPIFQCETNEKTKQTFGVVVKCSIETKRQMMQNVDEYIGQMLTVKYQEKSEDGIPRFPVGLGFRNYE
jgi:DNA ligase-1